MDTFRKEYTVFMDREKKQEKPPRRRRRKFTPEFREGAVALVLDEGRPISHVAEELDITHSGLSEWVKQAKAPQ